MCIRACAHAFNSPGKGQNKKTIMLTEMVSKHDDIDKNIL